MRSKITAALAAVSLVAATSSAVAAAPAPRASATIADENSLEGSPYTLGLILLGVVVVAALATVVTNDDDDRPTSP